jgi:hypothetical protein
MPIVVSCTCGRRLRIGDEYAGREGQCPACGRTFDIPAAEPVEEAVVGPSLSQAVPEEPAAEPAPAPEPQQPQQEPVEVRNHGGDPLPSDIDFFAPPPPEIGPVVTAYSTLRKHRQPMPGGARAGVAMLCGGLGLLLILLLVYAFGPRSPAPYIVFPLFVGGLAAGISLLVTRFKHTCSYVGREGVARFRCAGDRDQINRHQVFLFKDAAELRTRTVLHFVNGGYTGTEYTFTWTDVGGQTRFVWRGRHNSREGKPPSKHPYHFGRSAEIAWSTYLLPGALRQLELSGAVLFLLSGDRWIRVRRDALVIHAGGKEEEWDARDIACVVVESGVVRIKRRDAKEGWFSSSGVFKFDFTSLPNAQLFFFLVQRVLGLPVP